MIIETARLRLRPFYDHEADALLDLVNTTIDQNLKAGAQTQQDARDYIARVHHEHTKSWPYVFAMAKKDDDGLIGYGGIEGVNYFNTHPALGYAIAPSYWGLGYATEAVRAIIDISFTKYRKTIITACITTTNRASENVARKAGLDGYWIRDVDRHMIDLRAPWQNWPKGRGVPHRLWAITRGKWEKLNA